MSVDNYMKLPYHICFIREVAETDGAFDGYSCVVLELSGCLSQGETLDEAMAAILDAMRIWITVELEDGHRIPSPYDYKEVLKFNELREAAP